jgi:hypothetical protein
MLVTADESWISDICEKVKGMPSWVGIGVRVEDISGLLNL